MASKTCETPPPSPQASVEPNLPPVPADAVRMVGIRKVAGEHLVRFTRLYTLVLIYSGAELRKVSSWLENVLVFCYRDKEQSSKR